MSTQEQLAATQKANIETLYSLTSKAFKSIEQLVELNMQATKAALHTSASHTQAMLSVKDAQDLLALQAGLFQPLTEKVAAYSRQLYDIASNMSGEFSKELESKMADTQSKISSLVDSAAKNAPAGSEAAVAMLKGAVATANNAYESVQKAVKQASEVAQANFNAVASAARTARGAAPTAASRKR